MSQYFDTPALVFACGKSDLGEAARHLISKSDDPITIPHAVAECFNTLTYRLRLSPKEIRGTMRINFEPFRLVMLEPADYWGAIERVVDLGLTGDKIYDALHAAGAAKGGADKIYTSNRRDFAALTKIPIHRIA